MTRLLVILPLLASVALFAPHASASPASINSTQQAHPSIDPRIEALAKEWLRRFQTANIDRQQLNAEVSASLTPTAVARESAKLKPLGAPTSFHFVSTEPVGYAVGYDFMVSFKTAKVLESLALDASGKIAGIDFRIFVPR